MARPMIPDGPTERIKNAGGESLFFTLALAMAGQDIATCVYAVSRLTANLGLSFSDLEATRSLIRQMAEDAINELELNWPDREKLLAASKANLHLGGGHG